MVQAAPESGRGVMEMSGTGLRIRLASEADYTALGLVFAEAERYHREALPHVFRAPQDQFPPRSLFRRWVSEAGSAVLVADDVGDLVGFVSVRTDSAPDEGILQPRNFAVVDTLAVRSDQRRRGIGRSLMEAVHAGPVVPQAPSGQAGPGLAPGTASARHHGLDDAQRAPLHHLPHRLCRVTWPLAGEPDDQVLAVPGEAQGPGDGQRARIGDQSAIPDHPGDGQCIL